MSTQTKPQVRYRSTGKPIRYEKDEPKKISPLVARNEAMRQIEAHRAGLEKTAQQKHDEAVHNFDYAYQDLTSNPVLLKRVEIKRAKRIEDAARNNQVIDDWHSTLFAIGEEVREEAGFASGAERERNETLAEMAKARGQYKEV